MPSRPRRPSFLSRVNTLLTSRALSFAVLGAWIALLLVWLLPFQLTGQPDATIQAIAWDWLAFRVVYVTVAVTTLLCAYARFGRDLRRAREVPSSFAAGPRDAARRIAGTDLDEIAGALQSRGYALVREERSLYARRNRWSPLGGTLLHLGVSVVCLAFVVVAASQRTASVDATEGQTIGQAASALTTEAAQVLAPVSGLTVESIDAEYFEDVLLFTKLDSTLRAPGGDRVDLSLSRPHWVDPVTFLSIQDYDYAPHLVVSQPGVEPHERVVSMELFPPGTEDSLSMPDLGAVVSVIAYPDYGVVDGRDVSLSYNIRKPKFLVSIESEGPTRRLLARRLVGLDEPIEVDGAQVSVSGLSQHGVFRITRIPGWPLMALGGLLMSVGVGWRTLLRRHDAIIWDTAEGLVYDSWLDISGRDAGRALLERILRKAREGR